MRIPLFHREPAWQRALIADRARRRAEHAEFREHRERQLSASRKAHIQRVLAGYIRPRPSKGEEI